MNGLKTLKDIYGNKANGQISVKELKAELRKRGKTVTGNKDVLIERLLNE